MSPSDQPDITLDEADIEILEHVERDSDVNLADLADQLGLSKSGVHYRLNKLKDAGVISATTADIDPLSLGLSMLLITDVSVSHERGYSEDIGKKLVEVDGTTQVYYTMGDIDFVVLSRVQDRQQANELLEAIVAIDGVNETSSKFVMKEHQQGNRTVANMSDAMLEAVVDQ